MDEEYDHVCADCETRLLKNIKPLRSLANHIWVGKVPWQLKDSSYAEKMLVAKVRRNRYVIRVASGPGKLSAASDIFYFLFFSSLTTYLFFPVSPSSPHAHVRPHICFGLGPL